MTVAYESIRCPACGERDAVELADRDDVRGEIEALWTFHIRRVRPGTPVARLVDRVVFTHPPALRLVRCRDCGTVYRDPAERGIIEAYARERLDTTALRAILRSQRATARDQVARLTRIHGGASEILEVGCYSGAFLAAARERGWRVEGVDVNEDAVRFVRMQEFTAYVGTVDEVPADRRFDAVAVWNCFEQLPEPVATLRSIHGRLAPGGTLAVRVPNGGFYATLRHRLDGPAALPARAALAHNNLLGFPYRHGFTPDSLADLLRREGFDVMRRFAVALPAVAEKGLVRPWALVEAHVARALLRRAPRASAAPWFETYARRRE